MKKQLLLSLFCLLILISSCGSEDSQEIEFNGFVLSISNSFKEIDGTILENKQIINKILKSYYKRENNGFKDNLIISRTNIDNGLNSEEYSQTNLDKLQHDLVGFSFIEKDNISIKCGNDKISLYYLKYSIIDDIFGNKEDKYFILQYYYVYNNSGYIISYVSTNQDTLKEFEKSAKTLNCK